MSNPVDEKKIKDLIHSIGLLNNLSDEETRLIVESQFRFTYETIKNLNTKDLSDEELDKLKTNFYYKYIGKLYTNSEIIKKHSFYKQKKEEEDGREES